MSEFDLQDGINRRKVLECMTWCGTGVLWTISGGVPHSLGIMGEAQAAETNVFTFLQISDFGFFFVILPLPGTVRKNQTSAELDF